MACVKLYILYTIYYIYYRGGNVNFIKKDKDTDGVSVLHNAAERGSVEMISWLIKKKAQVAQRTSSLKRTPLMLACRGDHIPACMLLMKNGAMKTVNMQDSNGMTALHFATIGKL